MKKGKYEEPRMQILLLGSEDVITLSNGGIGSDEIIDLDTFQPRT